MGVHAGNYISLESLMDSATLPNDWISVALIEHTDHSGLKRNFSVDGFKKPMKE